MGEARRKAQIEGAEMSQLIGSKSCRSCEWRAKLHSKLFCRRFPPQNIGGLMPGPNGQPITVFTSSYPEVNADLPCGEYKRNELHASEELSLVAIQTAAQ